MGDTFANYIGSWTHLLWLFAHLNPHSSAFGDICALYSPFLHQLTVPSSLFEPGRLRPCPSYSRRGDHINLGLLRSFYKGGRGITHWVRRAGGGGGSQLRMETEPPSPPCVECPLRLTAMPKHPFGTTRTARQQRRGLAAIGTRIQRRAFSRESCEFGPRKLGYRQPPDDPNWAQNQQRGPLHPVACLGTTGQRTKSLSQMMTLPNPLVQEYHFTFSGVTSGPSLAGIHVRPTEPQTEGGPSAPPPGAAGTFPSAQQHWALGL